MTEEEIQKAFEDWLTTQNVSYGGGGLYFMIDDEYIDKTTLYDAFEAGILYRESKP
jgi:hypothetical protein